MTETISQLLARQKEENGTYIIQQPELLPTSIGQHIQTKEELILLQKYPTFKEFFAVFNPQREYRICQNPMYCVIGLSPTLIQLDYMYGLQTSAKWLVILTANLSLNCGLKVDASDEQLHFTAIAIANKYKKLKASEIMLFFFNFKAGFFERFYGYFDTQTIIRSFELFLQERHKIIQRYEALIEEIRNKKAKRPGLSLEEINQNYFKTETLNKLLHKTF